MSRVLLFLVPFGFWWLMLGGDMTEDWKERLIGAAVMALIVGSLLTLTVAVFA